MDIEYLCGRLYRFVFCSCIGVCGGFFIEFFLVVNFWLDWCDVFFSVLNGSYNFWLEFRLFFFVWRVV